MCYPEASGDLRTRRPLAEIVGLLEAIRQLTSEMLSPERVPGGKQRP